MSDMKVKDVPYNFRENDKDWELACAVAVFEHKSECEFIFFVGEADKIDEYRELGFSAEFIAEAQQAREDGYRYLCLHSD